MSEDELFEQSMKRVREVMLKGTGCVEIKSGYGLNTERRTENAPRYTPYQTNLAT